MVFTRQNALDQALDIAGSLFQSQTLIESDEPLGFGAVVTGQSGTSASITNVSSGIATISNLSGFSASDISNFITLSGASVSQNNGTFLIVAVNSSSQILVSNPNAVFPDSNSGSINWIERYPYRLQDDLNYIRTDRQKIKGTTNWYDPIPTYYQPTNIVSPVFANLSNIAGKTTDAVSYNVNRAFYSQSVSVGETLVTISSPGNLKHSSAVPNDITGIPVFDTGYFAGNWSSCYVHITDGYLGYINGYQDGYNSSGGNELTVISGPNAGQRIFGITFNGGSSSPDSVEVHFFSAPYPANFTTSATPYTWEQNQTTTINLLYGYNERLDELDENAFRTVPTLGILTDANINNSIINITNTIGTSPSSNSLAGLLTNTIPNYPFYDLPNATPTVVEALNVLNQQIGNQTYSGSILSTGQTVAQSLQAIANAISSGGFIMRTIERLSTTVLANVPHTLPAGLTYTIDPTQNGQYLWVTTRGVLRDPGSVSNNDYYQETTSTSITFFQAQPSGTSINYFTK